MIVERWFFIFLIVWAVFTGWEYLRDEYTEHMKMKYQRTLENIQRLEEWNATH